MERFGMTKVVPCYKARFLARLKPCPLKASEKGRPPLFVDFFIHRPVFATVCALLIILAGAVCIPTLPIAMYPSLAPPQVQVTTQLRGRQCRHGGEGGNHSAGRGYQRREGDALHQLVEHEQRHERDHHDIRYGLRPGHCRGGRAEPRGECAGPAALGSQRDGHHDYQGEQQLCFRRGIFYAATDATRREFISNYLDVYVKDAIKRVPGVGDVEIFGERKYAMRVWLDPVKLAARA